MICVSDPSLNRFEIVSGQAELIEELDRRFPTLEGCLIVVGE